MRKEPNLAMKCRTFIGLSIAILMMGTCGSAPGQSASKRETMDGSWTCVSATVDGKPLGEATVKQLRLTLTDKRYKTERGSEVLFDSDYVIDTSHKPTHIDIIGTEGDLKGKKAQGICLINGNEFKICYTMPGRPRPLAFESAPGSGAYFIVWKRQQP